MGIVSIANVPRTDLGGLLAIGTTATALDGVANGGRTSTIPWRVQVFNDENDPVYVGRSNVTASGATKGHEVLPGESYSLDTSTLEGWYAIAATAPVNVRITGREGGP